MKRKKTHDIETIVGWQWRRSVRANTEFLYINLKMAVKK